MKLKRIRIEQFRKFGSPVEITGLEPGLNILHGPNEAGKSTIAQAIRTLFFEKHNTKGDSFVSAISPTGAYGPSPTIEIDFLLGEDAGKVSKTFFQKPRASLSIAGAHWDGGEADEMLAERLGFGLSGKGASRADTHGIPGLLWIEQGASSDLNEAVEHAAGSLEERLKGILGDFVSTSGNNLLAAIETELGKLRTATGRATGMLAEAEKAYTGALARRDQLLESAGEYRSLSDGLARHIIERDRLDRERPWETYEQKRREAEAYKAALEPQQRALDASRQRLREISASIESLHEQNKAYDTDLRALAEQRATLTTCELSYQQACDALALAEQRKTKARDDFQMARAQQQTAEQRQRRVSLETEIKRIGAEIRRIEDILVRAGAFGTSIAKSREQAAATKLAQADLVKLEKLEQKLRDNRIQREAVATRIIYRLEEGQHIDAGELGTLQETGDRRITGPITLRIAGVGDIDIAPGGEDIERLSDEARQVGDDLAKLCGQLGISDTAEARARHARFLELERDIALQERERDTLLDDKDESEWRDDLADAQGRLNDHSRQLAMLPTVSDGMSLEAAQRASDDAEAESTAADKHHEVRQREASTAELALGRVQASIDAQSQRLESNEARRTANNRKQAFAEAVIRKGELEREIGDAEAALAERSPELIDADIQRYTQALALVENERRKIRDAISAARATLETLGADGIDEKLAVVEEEVRRQERRLDQYRLRANALDLLSRRLSEHQEAATQRLYAPLRAKLQHYLKILFPGTALDIGIDKLRPTALSRDGAELTLDAYSHGTREQLGVVARFAYADLLKQAGQPTLLILDDALVNSDADRRQQMKRIIHDASQRHQILMFTCHPEDWRDAGARNMVDVSNLEPRS